MEQTQVDTFHGGDLHAHNGTHGAGDKHEQPGRGRGKDTGVGLLSTVAFVTHTHTHCNTQPAIMFIYVTPSAEYTELRSGILYIRIMSRNSL